MPMTRRSQSISDRSLARLTCSVGKVGDSDLDDDKEQDGIHDADHEASSNPWRYVPANEDCREALCRTIGVTLLTAAAP